MYLCCMFLRYSTSNNGVALKSGLGVFQGHLKMALFGISYAMFYWTATVSMALFCTIFEIFDVAECRDLEGHSK